MRRPFQGSLRSRLRPRRPGAAGFTLIELLVAVAIIGIVSAIAVPAMLSQVEKARLTRIAADLRTFETGFASYAIDEGDFPDDTNIVLPTGMEAYVSEDVWDAEPPFGGNYNWEGPDYYPYSGISLTGTGATVEQMTRLDQILDDGDLTSGAFRVTTNGRYTFIIDE